MKKLFTTVVLATCALFAAHAQTITGTNAARLAPGAELVRINPESRIPAYVKLSESVQVQYRNFLPWLKSQFGLDPALDFRFLRDEKDQLGHMHYRYVQTYQGIPLEGMEILIHVDQTGRVYSYNGTVFSEVNWSKAAGLSETTALQTAMNYLDADRYKWEMPEEEEHIKWETNNPEATYFPTGELVFMPRGAKYAKKNFTLAWRFDIYADAPLYHSSIYIDANDGSVVFENNHICHADATGTAVTGASGTQTITTDSFGGGFRLRESGRGNGIETYDMNEGTNYGNAVDFTDADNFWNNANANQDEWAGDAHWGSEMTYDYFNLEHNRNSIDDAGFALRSYIHYDANYANAFWDGQRMTYGDGNGSTSPFTALDIAGHEISHGLTNFTANLVYQDESGALNESFSDIFGTAIEWYAKPGSANWTLGEDIGLIIRSLSNPGTYGDPDTYGAGNWYTGTADNGGVHTNSGVQNFWFYLLINGGTGTNDLGNAYNVTGLGMDDAAAIAFRNLTVYLSTNSQYSDARFYSIQAAQDLYGACSQEVISTTNAWHAVGVGAQFDSTVVSDYNPSTTGGCTNPLLVNFTNASQNGGTFQWDFGDGTTSTALNPTHTYTANGNYTITLIADGGLCGVDTLVQTSQISVGQLPAPTAIDDSRCDPGNLTLGATGGTNYYWWDSQVGGTLLDSGASYTTPVINSTTTYYVEAQTGLYPEFVGPPDNTFGTGGYFTGNQSLVFDVYRDVTLVSVWVDANGGGNRDIEVYDNGGTLVASTTVNIPNGQSRVTLNFNLTPGTGYTITSPSPDLYRNNASAAYPYEIPNLLSITSSSAGGDYYYFFYDWELQETPCSSDRVPVVAAVASAPTTTDDNLCGAGVASLSASGSGVGNLVWWDAAVGGNQVNTGTTFNPNVGSTTTYYVEEDFTPQPANAGPVDNTFGGGGYFTGDQHLVFDVTTPVTLNSVWVDANGAGNRTIELRDNGGAVLQSTTVNIPNGQSRVTLNFPLPVGTNLQLGVTNGSSPDLYRNNAGPSFPYDLPGILSITSSSAGNQYYYFFYDWEVVEPGGCITSRIPVTANVGAAADATISSVAPLCITDGSLNLSAVDGGGTWSGNGITNGSSGTFDPGTAGVGTHTITYSIAGSCGDTDTETITVNAVGNATISSPGAFCTGDAALNLSAVDAGGTWSGNGITNGTMGTFDPGAAGPGTHTITYTIAGSCGDTDTETITVSSSQDATISAAGPFCPNDAPITLSAVDGGGTWSGNGITNGSTGAFDPSAAGAGTHTITYSIPGTCGDVDTYNIFISSSFDATISAAGPFCTNDVSLNLTAASGGGTWSGAGITDANAGTFDPSSAGAGTHTITYSIPGGCGDTDTETITITQSADATITPQSSLCLNDAPLNLTAAGTGGTWSGSGITNGTMGTFDPATAGVGTHTITYNIPGTCGDMDTETITVTAVADATINTPGALCSGDAPITLTAATTGGTWSGTGITDPNAGTFDPSVAGSGTFTITYTISGSCASSDTETITVNTQQDATVNSAGPFCEDELATNLSAATAGGVWSGNGITDANAGTFDPATAGLGTHTITYTIAGTCGDVGTINIAVVQNADASISAAGPFCENDAPINLSAASPNGTWSGSGITNTVDGTFDPATAGIGVHTITYTIADPCGDQQTVEITVDICEGIAEEGSNINVQLFPNPAREAVTLSLAGADAQGAVSLEVTDALGRTVYQSSFTAQPTGTTQRIDISRFAAGVYMLRLQGENLRHTEQLIVE